MILTTTSAIEGRPVKDYLGIVSGECVLTGGFFDSLGDVEDRLLDARYRALSKLQQRAEALGANAVVGISLDLEVQQAVRFLQVTGTAVVIP